MADHDFTITALTGDQIAVLDQNQMELSFTGGSMDFTYDGGLNVGAADSVFGMGNGGTGTYAIDHQYLNSNIDWGAINSSITLGPLMTDTMQVAPSSSRLTLTGDDADIEINGESVVGVLREIRDRLGILKVSDAMEAEWDELRALREQYQAKLAECEEKSRAWGALKQMPPPRMP